MTTRMALHHTTQYTYDNAIKLSPQLIRLRPTPHCKVPISAYSLKITPEKYFINWQQDVFSNFIAQIAIPEKTLVFKVEVDIIVEMEPKNPFDFFLEDHVKVYPFKYTELQHSELLSFFQISENGPLLKEFISSIDCGPKNTIDFLIENAKRVANTINYTMRFEEGIQNCETTLHTLSGSCRDMAWLLCQIYRHLGLAARFASGYLIQLKNNDDAAGNLIKNDLVDLHAWTEVYLPGAGWIGLDATSGLVTNENHIPLCCTPIPNHAAPISGSLSPCKAHMSYKMSLTRLSDKEALTRPYTPIEWIHINNVAGTIDADLDKQDVRLTMGGEPTFVNIHNSHKKEWSTEALGTEKIHLADKLLNSFKQHFTKGALHQLTQGKWYANEINPRWAFNCYWRVDQEPIWKNQSLLASIQDKVQLPQDADKFIMEKISQYLGVNPQHIMPAYEDKLYHLWQGQRLLSEHYWDQKHFQISELQWIKKALSETANTTVGYVLPVHWDTKNKKWLSSIWEFKSNLLFLIPGETSMGYRLPLADLAYNCGSEFEPLPETSLLQPSPELPSWTHITDNLLERKNSQAKPSNKKIMIPTAVCSQIRAGQLYIFIPPIPDINVYLELVAAIELAAAELNIPVMVEGFHPPLDPNLQRFSITPDPGVLEVNIHPTKNWQELAHQTEIVFQEAQRLNLSSTKFMMDGRMIGTGGGNHITLGSSSPMDSPFLRKPSLLQSMITFWQHHPSLSYLFSGLFIGPTCQAPRIDEARHESLYELEIAFQQLPQDETQQLWLIDRLLRHLLVDVTGNNHRFEFCIDKMFSPDHELGRQGLLELRAIEMTPHWQMNLVINLLIRGLVAHFWKNPYKKKLIRFGTALHDRFLLPYFIWQDFSEVVAFLNNAGYHFKLEWFKPFFHYRFPLYGSHTINKIKLELRMALEPWPILSEENGSGAMSRKVDSAIERVQIKVEGLIKDKYLITCNRLALPLYKTEKSGVYVAGVRFKAWPHTDTLHPNIPVHAPLIFDIIDLDNMRSIGGCTYHVSHPSGTTYTINPTNYYEAQTRLRCRFQNFGHTPGPIEELPSKVSDPEYPYTLDLRKFSW